MLSNPARILAVQPCPGNKQIMKAVLAIFISISLFGCGPRELHHSQVESDAAGRVISAANLEDLPATSVERDDEGKVTGVSSHTSFDDFAAKLLYGNHRLLYLTLLRSPISDQGIANLGELPMLEILSLTGSKITSECFKELVKFQSLQYLDISDTKIDGASLKWIGTMKQLKTLVIKNSLLKKEEINSLKDQLPLLQIEE